MVEQVDVALDQLRGRDVLSAGEVADLLIDLRRHAEAADAWLDVLLQGVS